MKKYASALLAVMLTVLLSGCGFWSAGSYSSVNRHEEYYDGQSLESLEASNQGEIQELIAQQVANGAENCLIYVTQIPEQELKGIMDAVKTHITQKDPIGAFAVQEIQYDIGTSTGRTAVAVEIAYTRSRSEILRIKTASDMASAMDLITKAVEECSAGVLVQVDHYEPVDVAQRVQDYVYAHPDTCMEIPQVSEAVYPQRGQVRVMEIIFTYQTSRDALRDMQEYVQPVFRAADLNVSGEEEESVKFSRMYAFLMERDEYQVDTSITPTYSLLRHGVGDSKAFATVYAAMCRNSGLECHVVSGTRSGEPWSWNMICQDGVYYHVDLLRSSETGRMQLFFEEDMDGYVWDYTAYPEAKAPPEPEQPTSSEPEQPPVTPDETVPEESQPQETLPEETQPETQPDVQPH